MPPEPGDSNVPTLADLVRPERYPRASAYDPAWVARLDMGPHPLWLLEDLSRDLDLRPGMRVLDLGSGQGATSVFLAREFGVQVVAADRWVDPDAAAATFADAGVSDRVLAVRADANALPFGAGQFDAVVSIDAFEYFGTGDHVLPMLARQLRPGGQIAVATPALRHELRELGGIPEHIRRAVGWEALAWHTPAWWRFQWEATGLVEVTSARWQDAGWEDWLLWHRATRPARPTNSPHPAAADRRPFTDPVLAMLEQDRGALLGFALITARTPPPPRTADTATA
jgi:SAM-dependent methyltransferase